MAKVDIVLNSAGVRALLKSAEMRTICEDIANNAVASLGPGYEASSYNGKNRVNASVKAVSREAKKDNAKNNTILKAVGG